ncbi:MAG: right-handed parallel beta-helix repeat-containing protein [Planctomycetota bacterium]|nr:right-handed parallel beta-helix repeat-containing protein [Planctomycetota bacterium]
MPRAALVLLLHACALLAADGPAPVEVRTTDELRAAVAKALPGSTIRLAPGVYDNLVVDGTLQGRPDAPIVIEGLDPKNPPVVDCAKKRHEGLHFKSCSWLVVRHIVVKNAADNGVYVADPARYERRDDREARDTGQSASHHILLEHLTVLDTGAGGNHDAFKVTFSDYVTVRNCHAEGWGGSAIDVYGARYVLIEKNRWIGKPGFKHTMGINIKGYATDALLRGNYFEHAAQDQTINIGGPHDRGPGAYECRRVEVCGNVFVGGGAPCAWLGADGGRFHRNTVVHPGKWFLRIGYRMEYEGGAFEHNLLVFDSRKMKSPPTSILENLNPKAVLEKFRVRGNAWWDVQNAEFRPTGLPVAEEAGVYGVDPQLTALQGPGIRKGSDDARLKDVGAEAYAGPAYETWHPGPP